jgi:3-oxoacyl-[acyl-carrier-protein] synthase-3
MYAGAEKDAQGELHGWREHSHAQWGEKSIFAIKQDVRLLNENVVRATFAEPLAHIAKKYQLHANTIDWFLPHVSSNYFVKPIAQAMIELGFVIPSERWFTNLTYCGNTGSASPFIMLEELFNSNRLKHGQKLLMFIPESGRFSSGFVHLEVVDANA